jgi:RimJ/RimL family protein N-acetyltransferase
MKALLSQSRGEAVHFMMSLATTGTPIGHTAVIAIRNEHRRCEIGWSWIFKDYQRQGYALETKLAFYTLLFQHGYRRVQITADARNHASIRSIDASGARFEGELEDVQFLADGTFRNTVVYRMLRHEWAPGTVCLG